MIAISILTMGFLGITTLLARSFVISHTTANDLTATYLASEGIEIAKNLIDHDVYRFLATPPQGTGWGSCCAVGNYSVYYGSSALTPYPNPLATPPAQLLIFHPTTGLYDYVNSAGSVPTNFNRWIQISVPQANEIVVNSFVAWPGGQTVNLEDHFYNWHP